MTHRRWARKGQRVPLVYKGQLERLGRKVLVDHKVCLVYKVQVVHKVQ